MPLRLEPLLVAFIVSALSCVAIGGGAIRCLQRQRWLQPLRHNDCPPLQAFQLAKHGTPTMGGLLVLGVAAVMASLLGGLRSRAGWMVLGTILIMGIVGVIDDVLKLTGPNGRGLRSGPKLIVALLLGASIGLMLSNSAEHYRTIVIPAVGRVALGWWFLHLSMFVVAGSAHAVNLTDGMDGLAAGCLTIAFLALALVAALDPSSGITDASAAVPLWCLCLAGACLGFLWFNAPPAAVFLGDVGALGLGAALGVLALLSHAAFVLFIVGGIFVAEAISVMLQVATYRYGHQRRLFRVAPLHHHFQVGGVPEPKLVTRFWVAGLMLAALGCLAAFSVTG